MGTPDVPDRGPDRGPDQLLDRARTAARKAGALAQRMRAEGVDVAGTKSSPTDIVTEADQACERLIREHLLDGRPGDAFFGEESGQSDADSGASGVRWIVDPIDGTVNYLYGLPHYAVSVAAEVDSEVVAGVVVAPELQVEYSAVRGGGAFRNGERVPPRTVPGLDQALVASGFSYERDVRAHQAQAIARLLPQVRDIRRIGSCALDLCGVATGTVDAYVEEGPHLWDHAAAGLVAQECGAVLRVWPTSRGMDLVACAPGPIWAEFEALVDACGFR